jgi:hypothetical protein
MAAPWTGRDTRETTGGPPAYIRKRNKASSFTDQHIEFEKFTNDKKLNQETETCRDNEKQERSK